MEALTEGLGTEFETLRIAYKTRPMSHTVFASVDAVGAIVERERVAAEDVAEIVIRGPAYLGQNFWRTRIETFEDAACSAPFVIALNVVAPAVMTFPDTVLAHLNDDRVHRLMARCVFEEDPNVPLDAADLPGSVTMLLRDGRRFDQSQPATEHASQLKVRQVDLEHKFARGATNRLGPDAVTDIVANVATLERLDDVRSLTRRLQS